MCAAMAAAGEALDASHFYDWMQIGECPKELRGFELH